HGCEPDARSKRQRLGDDLLGNRLVDEPSQIGEGAADSTHPVVSASRQLAALEVRAEVLCSRARQRRELGELIVVERGVETTGPLQGEPTRRGDTCRDDRRGLPLLAIEDV